MGTGTPVLSIVLVVSQISSAIDGLGNAGERKEEGKGGARARPPACTAETQCSPVSDRAPSDEYGCVANY